MNEEELGHIVRFHRKRAGLTQQELARLSGVGKATVFEIEKGKPTVQLKNILLVLNALNIALSWESPLKAGFQSIKK